MCKKRHSWYAYVTVLSPFHCSIWLLFHSFISKVPVTWRTRAWSPYIILISNFIKLPFIGTTQRPCLNLASYRVTCSLAHRIWCIPGNMHLNNCYEIRTQLCCFCLYNANCNKVLHGEVQVFIKTSLNNQTNCLQRCLTPKNCSV